MRTLVVIICLFYASGTTAMDEEMAELAKMIREGCVAETEVDMSLIDRVNGGEALMADPKLKCYIKCVMETAGMMSEGVVEVEAVIAMMPPEMAEKSAAGLRSCGSPKGADDCETAFLAQKCWQDVNKKDYFLV